MQYSSGGSIDGIKSVNDENVRKDFFSSTDPGSYEELDSEKKKNIALFLRGVSSEEHIADEHTGELTPYFTNVNLTVSASEIWGISSNELTSARLLCQVIGNMRSYHSGQCQLGPLGTTRSKRRILPHLFYIDTHEMVYSDKLVLEQLMFSTGKVPNVFGAVDRQAKMLRLLESVGMAYIALSRISDLYNTEKLLLELLIASESDSRLIICDWTGYTFSQSEIEILSNITDRLRYLGKAAVIATMQPKLIGITCDNTLFICKGEPIFCGSISELYANADRVAFVLRDSNPKVLGKVLSYLLPGWRVKVSGNTLLLCNYTDRQMRIDEFLKILSDNKVAPEVIKVNSGRVSNSFEELVEQYDLQRQSV